LLVFRRGAVAGLPFTLTQRIICMDVHAAGEHMHEFEPFETQKFVGRLLGRGDWGGFIDKVKDVIPEVSEGCRGVVEAVSAAQAGKLQ
jgi:signal recognition particle GTPase